MHKESSEPVSEIAANVSLVYCWIACRLLDKQIAAQATKFELEGGFTERLYHVRKQRK